MSAEANLSVASAYYDAMAKRDMVGVAKHLHPDVEFLTPLAQLTGRDAVVQAANRFAGLLKGLNVRAKFASSNQAMIAYDAEFGQPIGACRTAALMTFRDGVITRLELFYDGRPFENTQTGGAIFSR